MGNFGDYQLQIYLQGMLQGTRPEITTDLARLESQAAGTLWLDLRLALSGYANHRELDRDSVVRG